MPAAATHTTHTHTQRTLCFSFLKKTYLLHQNLRETIMQYRQMSPCETNMHPNREQKKTPRVYRDNFVVVVFKLDQNFCYPNQVGEKKKQKRRKSISLWTKTSSAVLFLDLPEVGHFYILYFFQNETKQKKKIALLNIL